MATKAEIRKVFHKICEIAADGYPSEGLCLLTIETFKSCQ